LLYSAPADSCVGVCTWVAFGTSRVRACLCVRFDAKYIGNYGRYGMGLFTIGSIYEVVRQNRMVMSVMASCDPMTS